MSTATSIGFDDPRDPATGRPHNPAAEMGEARIDPVVPDGGRSRRPTLRLWRGDTPVCAG